MTSRIFALFFGVACYGAFFAWFLYMIGFLANFGVPKSIDVSPAAATTASPFIAAAINVALVAVFGLQHSIMARPGFKRVWTKIVPPHLERSTYVLFSVAVGALLFWGWQPMTTVVWQFEHEVARTVMWTLFLGGFALLFTSTVLLNHFELFGLRQVWLHARGKAYTDLPFETPALYKVVRHPLYVGWMSAMWFTPDMTVGHLLFAGLSTAYIFVALIFEERDLVTHFGKTYEDYREAVPALMPRMGRRKRTPKTATARG